MFPIQCVSFGTMGKYLFKPALQIILHPMKLLFEHLVIYDAFLYNLLDTNLAKLL